MSATTRLLTFDVTGTLIKPYPAASVQYSTLARRFGLRPDERLVERSFRTAYKESINEAPNFGYGHGMSARDWWTRVIRRTMQYSGVAFDELLPVLEPMSAEAYDQFATASSWAFVNDGVPALLAQVRRRVDTIGVISNFDERLHAILADMHVNQHFDFILTSREVGVAKPTPAIFDRALNLAHITSPGETGVCLHVGDTWINDVVGPIKSSPCWRAALIQPGGNGPSQEEGDERTKLTDEQRARAYQLASVLDVDQLLH